MMKWVVLPLTILFALAWDFEAVRTFTTHHVSSGTIYKIGVYQRLWPLFALGCAAYIWREKIRLYWLALGALFLFSVLTAKFPSPSRPALYSFVVMVLCLGLLTAKTKPCQGRWPDYSTACISTLFR